MSILYFPVYVSLNVDAYHCGAARYPADSYYLDRRINIFEISVCLISFPFFFRGYATSRWFFFFFFWFRNLFEKELARFFFEGYSTCRIFVAQLCREETVVGKRRFFQRVFGEQFTRPGYKQVSRETSENELRRSRCAWPEG